MLSKISKYFNKDSIYATPIRRIVSGVIDGLIITIFFNSYIYITTIIYNDSKPATYNILNSNTLSNENINNSNIEIDINLKDKSLQLNNNRKIENISTNNKIIQDSKTQNINPNNNINLDINDAKLENNNISNNYWIFIAISLFYYIVFLSSKKQATIGNQACRIMVVHTKYGKLSIMSIISRYFAFMINNNLLGLGYLLYFTRSDGAYLQDILSDTRVINY